MKKKILVVDDEPALLKVTLLRLNKSGYDAFGAADAPKGLDMARRRMPDLIVLDVLLPGMDGDEVAKTLKKDKQLKNTPILLMSAEVETLAERARESGADGYLYKPFEAQELLDMIGKRLAV
ncbi:MAG: response regulator [Candidatus Omnitrophota bacterium]|jgi:two-component system alkaline phosphatase synthesis response regulator PhoP